MRKASFSTEETESPTFKPKRKLSGSIPKTKLSGPINVPYSSGSSELDEDTSPAHKPSPTLPSSSHTTTLSPAPPLPTLKGGEGPPPAPHKGSHSGKLIFNRNYYKNISGSLGLIEIFGSVAIVASLSLRECHMDVLFALYNLGFMYGLVGIMFFMNGMLSGGRADLATGAVSGELPPVVSIQYYSVGFVALLAAGVATLTRPDKDILVVVAGTVAVIVGLALVAHAMYHVRHS